MLDVKFSIEVTSNQTLSGVVKPTHKLKEKLNKNQFPKPHYTPRDVAKFNALDVIQVLIWFDENSLQYNGDFLLIKDHNHCIVCTEGVYDTQESKFYNLIDTLKTFYNLSFPKACYVANTFMEKVTYSSIREYCAMKYSNAKKHICHATII